MTKNDDYYKLVRPYWVINIIGMLFITIITLKPESVPFEKLSYLGRLSKYLYYEHTTVFTTTTWIAWAIHVLEGLYAVNSTRSVNMSSQCRLFWFIQTFLVGFPSLNLLNPYLRSIKSKNN